MAWPLGKARSDKDKDAISKGKKGKAISQEHREAISRGQARKHAERKAKKDSEGKGGSAS